MLKFNRVGGENYLSDTVSYQSCSQPPKGIWFSYLRYGTKIKSLWSLATLDFNPGHTTQPFRDITILFDSYNGYSKNITNSRIVYYIKYSAVGSYHSRVLLKKVPQQLRKKGEDDSIIIINSCLFTEQMKIKMNGMLATYHNLHFFGSESHHVLYHLLLSFSPSHTIHVFQNFSCAR